MGLRVQAKFEGVEQLVRQLGEMRRGMRTKALRPAMRKSASLVNKAAKANIKAHGAKDTGQLKKSIGVKVKVYPSGVVIGVVEPRAGFRIAVVGTGRQGGKARYVDPRYYAHLVEGGVRPHSLASGTRLERGLGRLGLGGLRRLIRSVRAAVQGSAMHPGVPARPFLGPALAVSIPAIEAIFAEAVEKALAEVAR
jgi:HK97 gp10 family phage protein